MSIVRTDVFWGGVLWFLSLFIISVFVSKLNTLIISLFFQVGLVWFLCRRHQGERQKRFGQKGFLYDLRWLIVLQLLFRTSYHISYSDNFFSTCSLTPLLFEFLLIFITALLAFIRDSFLKALFLALLVVSPPFSNGFGYPIYNPYYAVLLVVFLNLFLSLPKPIEVGRQQLFPLSLYTVLIFIHFLNLGTGRNVAVTLLDALKLFFYASLFFAVSFVDLKSFSFRVFAVSLLVFYAVLAVWFRLLYIPNPEVFRFALDPNFFGVTLEFAIFFWGLAVILHIVPFRKGKKLRYSFGFVMLFVFVVYIVALIATESRSSYVSIIISSLLASILLYLHKHFLKLHSGTRIAFFLLLFLVLFELLAMLFVIPQIADQALQIRVALWSLTIKNALSDLWNLLLGHGAYANYYLFSILAEDNLAVELLRSDTKENGYLLFTYPHNQFLSVLYAEGMFGIILHLLFLWVVLREFFSGFLKRFGYLISFPLLAMFLAFFIHGITEATWSIVLTGGFFAFFTGLFFVRTSEEVSQNTTQDIPIVPFRILGSAILLVSLSIALPLFVYSKMADDHFGKMQKNIKDQAKARPHFLKSADYIGKAASLASFSDQLYLKKARLYAFAYRNGFVATLEESENAFCKAYDLNPDPFYLFEALRNKLEAKPNTKVPSLCGQSLTMIRERLDHTDPNHLYHLFLDEKMRDILYSKHALKNE